jgi:hypothetical protein
MTAREKKKRKGGGEARVRTDAFERYIEKKKRTEKTHSHTNFHR